MKYGVLLPDLLRRKLVQTRPPPCMPKKLPAGYRPDLSCVFHQGAPGHDIERCFAFRNEVQKLIQDKGILAVVAANIKKECPEEDFHVQRLARDATICLAGILYFMHISTGAAPPPSLSIQCKGTVPHGGQSPVNGSSNES
ncbi:hypothetical protein MTR_3g090210 [Medicago truncatula]|uniref:Uncharacterized protein n=1 Tax=Medicago truncatula TaxID=3880 RepID=A0A072V172_MEDTR|nr:hypothetical protein MTR_3g090210 [Medicago truncatula]